MTPMLRLVARAYAEACRDDLDFLSRICFVFPNKRSATFFLRYLDLEIAAPHIEPATVTIADFVADMSPLAEAPRFMQLATLYEAYRDLADADTIPDFDRFLFWGETLLSDFADVDRYLADPARLFTNIEELREINSTYLTDLQLEIIRRYWGDDAISWGAYSPDDADAGDTARRFWTHVAHSTDSESEAAGKFVRLWQILLPLYESFNSRLEAGGYATSGRQYRHAAETLRSLGAEALDRPAARYVFVGFNQLSTAEVTIFSELRKAGLADFYWDVASDAFTLEGNSTADDALRGSRIFPSLLTLGEEPVHDMPEVEIIGVASNVAQAKVAASVVKRWNDEGLIGAEPDEATGTDTALVLADEALLMPALSHLPEGIGAVNITMGFPMKLTPVAAVMRSAVALQRRLRQVGGEPAFFYEDVLAILAQPIVRAIAPEATDSLQRVITEEHLFTIAAARIAAEYPELAPIFTPLTPGEAMSLEACRSYFLGLISLFAIYADEERHPAERRFLEAYRAALDELTDAFRNRDITMRESTMASLIERAIASATVSFAGEPLQGIQLMGVLETRSLDFTNIVMTSMNEGIFPRSHARPSFIPEALRTAFSLPSRDMAERVYGYYFYRLLTRARRVALLYDARTSAGEKVGQISRYLTQLLYMFPGAGVTHKAAAFSSLPPARRPSFVVPKDGEVLKALDLFRQPGSRKNLSASALNSYIECPLRFYLTTVRGLNFESATDGEDYIDYSTFGSIFHRVAETLYTDLAAASPDGVITRDTLQRTAADHTTVERHVVAAINRIYLRRVRRDDPAEDYHPLSGANHILGSAIARLVERMLANEARDIGDIPLVGTETAVEGQVEFAPGLKVNVRQVIDRIDLGGPGRTMRFVDFKTGSDKLTAKSVEEAFNPNATDRPKVLFQLLFYCYCYSRLTGYEGPIEPFVYLVRSLYVDELKPLRLTEAKADITDYRPLLPEFEERLSALVSEIFNPDIPFEAAVNRPDYDGHACTFCRFSPICNPPGSNA